MEAVGREGLIKMKSLGNDVIVYEVPMALFP